jgi:hypothetical protein
VHETGHIARMTTIVTVSFGQVLNNLRFVFIQAEKMNVPTDSLFFVEKLLVGYRKEAPR